jgi:hypothetical protein
LNSLNFESFLALAVFASLLRLSLRKVAEGSTLVEAMMLFTIIGVDYSSLGVRSSEEKKGITR